MAKAFLSTDPYKADQTPASPEIDLLVSLEKERKARTLGAYNTKQIVQSVVPYKFNMAIATVEAGGARVPGTPAEQNASSFSPSDPRFKKFTGLPTAVQYIYDFSYYLTGLGGGTLPTGDFVCPVYLTLGYSNYNYFRFGSGVDIKYSVINSFQIANLDWDSSTFSFQLLNLIGGQRIRDRIDWTIPVENRPLLTFFSGIPVRDFTNTDPTKLTIEEKSSLLNGDFSTLFISVCVDTTGLNTTNQDFMALDVAPNFFFYGTISFDFFGVGAAYTPIA